jgi:SOS-response transcriptional repressor LexA/DNA-binding XRE family transcriptional regulator
MTVGDRICKLREAKGLTQKELGILLGYSSSSTVSNWETNIAIPDFDKLIQLCNIFNVTSDELLGIKSDIHNFTTEERTHITKLRMLDEHGKLVVNYLLDEEYARVISSAKKKNRPRLMYINSYSFPVSAGVGSFVENEAPEQILVPECAEAEEADYVLTVTGDSMQPKFNDGDKVYVVNQQSVEIGEIGIFVINGDAYIKKLGKGQLISLNEKYKPIPLNNDDSIYCFGKVIGKVEE